MVVYVKLKICILVVLQIKILLIKQNVYLCKIRITKKGFKFDHVWDMMKDFEKFKDVDAGSDSTSSQRPIGVKKAKLKRKIEEGFSSAMQMVQSENNRLVELLAKSGADRQRDLEMKDRDLKLKEFKEENKILLSNLDSIGDPNIREFILQEQKRIMDKRSQQFQQPQPQQSSAPYTQYFNDIGGSGNDLPELYIRNYYHGTKPRCPMEHGPDEGERKEDQEDPFKTAQDAPNEIYEMEC
ncbi:uncharacterized protein LOC132034789 [Lycium ferocissimum]|uniref:uncharacterized protein LOC132034789 n=1 Tax=Lycium ferocissimum TaxID=112874 RepID=UPI002815E2A5|nr:uncharacterized protein LOC132034789 [Lycium ferocissimum]